MEIGSTDDSDDDGVVDGWELMGVERVCVL